MLSVGMGLLIVLVCAGIYLSLQLSAALDWNASLILRLENQRTVVHNLRQDMAELETELQMQRNANHALLRSIDIKDRLLENANTNTSDENVSEGE